jgi:hypothetical protein
MPETYRKCSRGRRFSSQAVQCVTPSLLPTSSDVVLDLDLIPHIFQRLDLYHGHGGTTHVYSECSAEEPALKTKTERALQNGSLLLYPTRISFAGTQELSLASSLLLFNLVLRAAWSTFGWAAWAEGFDPFYRSPSHRSFVGLLLYD